MFFRSRRVAARHFLLPSLIAAVLALSGCAASNVATTPPDDSTTPPLSSEFAPNPDAATAPRMHDSARTQSENDGEPLPPAANENPQPVDGSDPLDSLAGTCPCGARFEQTGIASYYADKFHGRRTASGERYDMHALTAAHRTLPLGACVRVTSVTTSQSVVVRINDRGPFVRGRVIDLSVAAATALGMRAAGNAKVKLERLTATNETRGTKVC